MQNTRLCVIACDEGRGNALGAKRIVVYSRPSKAQRDMVPFAKMGFRCPNSDAESRRVGSRMNSAMAIAGLVFLVSMVVCHAIAKRKGRNPVFWGLMGALLGPLAIPFVLALKGSAAP